MSQYEKEILAKLAAREIPGYSEFTEEQQKALIKWCSDEMEYHEKKREKISNHADSKMFIGLLPIAVIIGLREVRWEFNLLAFASIAAAYILCALLFFVFGHAYDFFVLRESNSIAGTILFVVVTCVVTAMIGMLFFNVT